jgi:hypothetical protein
MTFFRSKGAGHRFSSDLIAQECSDKDARLIPLVRAEVNNLFLADLARERAGQLPPPSPKLPPAPSDVSAKALAARARKNASRRAATRAARAAKLAKDAANAG